jgi:Zn-dependent protease
LARLGWLNLLLGAFNLLPALPMDGGRMLRAFLARHRTNLEATVVAARVARVLGALMMAVGLFYDFWFLLIGLFVLLGANAEEQAARHAPARAPGRPDTREPQSLG